MLTANEVRNKRGEGQMKVRFGLGDQSGVVLVVALVMLLVLTVIGISAVSTSTFETSIAGNERLYNQAFYAADAGIEDFKATAPGNSGFLNDPSPSGSYYGSPKSVGGSSYDITWQYLGINDLLGLSYKTVQVSSGGVAPNFPASGRVLVESVIYVWIPAQGYDN
jgi:hypothetical protein